MNSEPILSLAAFTFPTPATIAIRVAIIVAVAVLCYLGIQKLLGPRIEKKLSAQNAMLIKKVLVYALWIVALALILSELGFSIGVILGAAGLLTVAIGFAAQTSISNIISGLFLVFEKPFKVGDVIRIEDTTAEVLSVDLLSIKVKTFDNLYVRFPNETVLKAKLVTLSRFDTRRVELAIGVAYKEDLRKVFEVLIEVAKKNEFSLEEPEPKVLFQGFADSSINLLLCVWGKRTDFLSLKNSLAIEVKEELDKQNIEIPFPQMTLHQAPKE